MECRSTVNCSSANDFAAGSWWVCFIICTWTKWNLWKAVVSDNWANTALLMAGVVIANLFVALPFVVLSVESGHRLLDRRYELASASLGAGANRRLTSITLPLLRPSILAGGLLAWGRALGEFGATITFAGNMPGTTQTLPLAVYGALETDRQLALAISLLMVSLSLFIVITMRQHWWSHR
jgi:molybdate transport system permease protein